MDRQNPGWLDRLGWIPDGRKLWGLLEMGKVCQKETIVDINQVNVTRFGF